MTAPDPFRPVETPAHLAPVMDAVCERIRDNPRTVDWLGVIGAFTDAHVTHLLAGERP